MESSQASVIAKRLFSYIRLVLLQFLPSHGCFNIRHWHCQRIAMSPIFIVIEDYNVRHLHTSELHSRLLFHNNIVLVSYFTAPSFILFIPHSLKT